MDKKKWRRGELNGKKKTDKVWMKEEGELEDKKEAQTKEEKGLE